jgi:hypothetical protein
MSAWARRSLNILVLNTGSSVVQEIWTNVPGIERHRHSDRHPGEYHQCPRHAGRRDRNYGNNYGERVRGYFTAPVTGNYYFWIAGSDSAQLWISDDNNQVNQVLRAWVTPDNNPTAPGQNGTSRGSGICRLTSNLAGCRSPPGSNITFKFLHKAGVGTNDNWSLAGCKTRPAPTAPRRRGARLSGCRVIIRPCRKHSGTLYSANLLALPGVATAMASARPRCVSTRPARRRP